MKLNPCQFKQGCFGCCGHTFTGKKAVREGMRKNEIQYKNCSDKFDFMKREELLRACGICHNLGRLPDGRIGCLVYRIDGKERRHETNCELDHECITFFTFKHWDNKKQQRFKKYVDSLDLDWYDFSIGMENGKIMKNFLKQDY